MARVGYAALLGALLLAGCHGEELKSLPSPLGVYLLEGTLTPPARVFEDNPRAVLREGELHGYDLALEAGDRVTLELRSECPSLEAGLYLFAPGEHDAGRPPVAASPRVASCAGPARIDGFEARASGRYLVVITPDLGSGSYQLDVACPRCEADSPWTRARDQTADYTRMADTELFDIGKAIFEHVHQLSEGLGHGGGDGPPPNFHKVHNGPFGGPDSQSCVGCHNVGGNHGAGSLDENIYQGGDGVNEDKSFHRNPPPLRGLGLRQALASQLSATLTAQLDPLRTAAKKAGAPQTKDLCVSSLDEDAVCFATVVATPDGEVSGLDGNMLSYDADAGRIIVQPFGWKGRQATIQGFLGGGFRVHFGLQWETPIAKYCALDSVEPEQKRNFERTWGKGACHDPDEDGVSGEVSDGQLAAISVYLMKIDPPAPAPHEHRGREVFRAVGCSACHTRGFALASSVDRSLDVDVTLPVRDDGAEVEVWSDFRRHEMAFAGGDYHEFPNEPTTIDAYSFVTPPLWDIAATAPYMHDGRAATLEEAILAHDDDEHSSEAKDSVDQFKALPADDKQALLDFLGTLGKEFVGASDR